MFRRRFRIPYVSPWSSSPCWRHSRRSGITICKSSTELDDTLLIHTIVHYTVVQQLLVLLVDSCFYLILVRDIQKLLERILAGLCLCLDKKQNVPRPSEHPPVRGEKCVHLPTMTRRVKPLHTSVCEFVTP